MKKVVKKFFFIGLILGLIYHFFIYFDFSNSCLIGFIPTFGPSNVNTKTAIKLIKHSSPSDYNLVCKYVNVIDKNPSCGGFDGGCFHSDSPKKIYIGNDQDTLPFTAAIIIHETCHAIQNAEGRSITEDECYKKHHEFMENITVVRNGIDLEESL